MAIGLLANTSLATNAAARQQAVDFANQAVVLANQALQQPGTTALQDNVTTSTPPAVPTIPEINAATSTGGGIGTETVPVVAAPITPQPMKTIEVLFSANSDNTEAFVTINNTAGVLVRVKGLNVEGGILAGISFGKTYGEGWVYPASFTDSTGQKFETLSCDGFPSACRSLCPRNSYRRASSSA